MAAIAGRAVAATVRDRGLGKDATIANLYVIKSSKLAVERAWRPEVRDFARSLVAHHEDVAGKLGSFMGGMNEPNEPPTELDVAHQTLLDDLRGASNEAFDEQYLFQAAAHDIVLTLLRTFRDQESTAGCAGSRFWRCPTSRNTGRRCAGCEPRCRRRGGETAD